MPVYEGIGLISEKNPVVLEIGKSHTKCGFAGEVSPRCIIPSEIRRKDVRRSLVDFTDESDLYQMLVEFLHHLYCRNLLVTPKDRKVVVVESLFTTTIWRQTLAKVLYLHYEVQTVLWFPIGISTVSSTGGDTGLVIDFGSEEVQIIPVFNGVTILNAVISQELGSKAFDKNLKTLMAENCLDYKGSGDEELEALLTPEIVEDFRVRCCVVTSQSRAAKFSSSSSSYKPITFELDGKNFVQIHGSVREKAGELWFQKEDLEGASIPQMIFEALSLCPVDTRKRLASSLLISGGTSMLPGLKGRLLKELESLALTLPSLSGGSRYEFRIYDPPAKENYMSWLGGALYGATDAMSLRSVPKEFFLKHALLPDWCDTQYNMVNGLTSSGISVYGQR